MNSEYKAKIGVLATISKTMDWFMVDSMRNLAKNGYEIVLICNMEDGFAERNSDYAKCIHLPMKRGVGINELFFGIKNLKKLFQQEKFDALYYMSPNASMYAAIAGRLAKVPIRIYNQCGIRYTTMTGVKRKIFKFVEKLTCKMSTHVKAVSFKNMEYAVQEKLCPEEKISIVGIGGTIGVDLAKCREFDRLEKREDMRAKYGIPQDAFLYGYVGRINADKGINELIEAFLLVSEQVPEASLALVGMFDDANPVTPENLKVIQDHASIISTGYVPSSEVYYHMAMFDVLVHPTYREGFGMVIQEAMGVGVPVLTTDIPGPSEVVEEGKSGILCLVKDSKDLASKMKLLYGDPELREKLANAALERASKYFDRPIMLQNILDDMNRILCK